MSFPFFKKTVPPFVVSKEEFAIAENMSVSLFNASQAVKGRNLLEQIIREKKIPDNYAANYPSVAYLWSGFPQFCTLQVSLNTKLKKNPDKGLKHSFLMILGHLFALDNKQRHRTVDPNANGLVGRGGLGKVKLIQDAAGQIHTVKIQALSPINPLNTVPLVNRTWGILRKLGYLVAAVKAETKVYTIMHYFRGMNLATYFENGKRLSKFEKQTIALKMAWALRFVHDKNIIHGDIKENNFMISDPREGAKVTLIDFDSSWDLDNIGDSAQIPLLYNHYSAPEACPTNRQNGQIHVQYSRAADIYQLGRIYQNLFPYFHYDLRRLSHTMQDQIPALRPNINSVIQQLQIIKDATQSEDRTHDIRDVLYLSVLAVLFLFPFVSLSGLALTVLPITSMMLAAVGMMKVRDWFKKSSFTNLVAQPANPYDISPNLLNDLKNKQEDIAAFREGYQITQKGDLWQTMATCTRWRNYSKSYYAGVRWCELNPQDDSILENPSNPPSSNTRLASN